MINPLRKLSLRMRLTLLSAIVVICVALTLTLTSINRASTIFVSQGKPPVASFTPSSSLMETLEAPPVSYLNDESIAITSSKGAAAESEEIPESDISETFKISLAEKREFASSSLWMMLLVIGCGTLLTWIVAGKALKPVQVLTATVGTINAHNLSTRVKGFDAKDEISQLSDNFNHMLDKLELAFLQQKSFSVSAAHELKTPLAAIRTNLEVLELDEEPTAEHYQNTFAVIKRNNNRLIDLVDNLLQINLNQQEFFQEAIVTDEMLQEILAELSPEIENKGVTIEVWNNLPILYGNKSLLYSGLKNLLENAIQYNQPAGHITITLEEGTEQAIISIQDTGIGIAPEDLPHIFEPFYRADHSRNRKAGGSGLGLALVKSIAEEYQGQVQVKSKPGEGSLFQLILPQLSTDIAKEDKEAL